MAMAGLGSPAGIWQWPFHYFMAVRHEFLKITGMGPREEESSGTKTEQYVPGITVEHYNY